jgi:hypothetical protein
MPQFPTGKSADLISAGAADAVAMNGDAAIITTKSLTLAALTAYTFTISASLLKANSIPIVELGNGSNTQGVPIVATVTQAGTPISPGTLTIVIFNAHATQALNGTLQLAVLLIG